MKYEIHETLTDKIAKEIELIYPQVFGSFEKEKFFKRFSYHQKFILIMAYKNHEPVGFKFGYGESHDLFYSWTGGVIPSARNHGLASEMMRMQHDRCREIGYVRIETRSRNKFPEMVALNMKFGFRIVGTFTDTDNAPKIIFRKEL